jgi:hypothetical protein
MKQQGETAMSLDRSVMTDEQRKSVALEYLSAFDHGGVTSSGGSILDLFDDNAVVYFPKWGIANGKEEIAREFHYIMTGTDIFAIEGTTNGVHKDGPWSVGDPEWSAGRWCDVFEVRDWKIQRCFIYLDPDYAGRDTARYPWLSGQS